MSFWDDLDCELERHREAITVIADARVQEAVTEFKRRFPKRSLEIIFGMGGVFIAVDDCYLRDYDPRIITKVFGFLTDMLYNVGDITDNFQRGCPKDVEVK